MALKYFLSQFWKWSLSLIIKFFQEKYELFFFYWVRIISAPHYTPSWQRIGLLSFDCATSLHDGESLEPDIPALPLFSVHCVPETVNNPCHFFCHRFWPGSSVDRLVTPVQNTVRLDWVISGLAMSHRITQHHTLSSNITSNQIISHHLASYHNDLRPLTSYLITSHTIMSYPIISYHLI